MIFSVLSLSGLMAFQSKLRTECIEVGGNKSYPVGVILAVGGVFRRLGLFDVFRKHKGRGICLALP